MDTAAARFRACVERGDIDAAAELFTDDAVFHSPVAHRPYQGRETLRTVLRAAFTVFQDFHYTAEFSGPDPEAGHVLRFRARVDGRAVDGVDILVSGPGGISELTVMVRPYSAATALKARIGALLGG